MPDQYQTIRYAVTARSVISGTAPFARIDEDGFVWILDRADQVIIRGGFKVRPDAVRTVLEHDPRVRGAAAGELRDGAARALARYELTAEIRIVDTLPRTPSGKVDLMGVRRLFAVPGDKP